jgi:Flp pilus assembly protein TadD
LIVAEQMYRRILTRQSDHADAQYLLGDIAARRGDNLAAAQLIRGAIASNAKEPQFHFGLGCALQGLGDWDGAMVSYRRALLLDPSHSGAHLNLGCILQDQGESRAASRSAESTARDLDEAISHFQTATELAAENSAAWMNLAYAMERQGNFGEALRFYDQALAIDPNLAQARFNRSMVLLALGRMREGWNDYEWRWEASGYPRPSFPQPEWDGSALSGKRLLLYTEQGFGDAIQFARYAAVAAERGAQVTLRCAPELVSLLASAPGISMAVSAEQALPSFDVHCALLSLPRVLSDAETSIPFSEPYIRPSDALVAQWRSEIRGPELKIGLAWASQPQNRIAPLKSASLETFAPFLRVPGAHFYSLQKGEAATQAMGVLGAISLTDVAPRLRDFADTAAVIANLDMVISVDTAVAHLAGAMGKPVWTLLPYVRDWRWYPDPDATALYPSMRLYRQTRRGDWSEAVARIADHLKRLLASRATSPT